MATGGQVSDGVESAGDTPAVGPDVPGPACDCGRIKIGSEVTEARNWSPDCPEHGTDSAWYQSETQVVSRQLQSTRLRVIQTIARLRRKGRLDLAEARALLNAVDGTTDEEDDHVV
jgi:hypothetical protein